MRGSCLEGPAQSRFLYYLVTHSFPLIQSLYSLDEGWYDPGVSNGFTLWYRSGIIFSLDSSNPRDVTVVANGGVC